MTFSNLIYARFSTTALSAAVLASAVAVASFPGASIANSPSSLEHLAGRWTGDGRLGFKDGKAETVSCRATYVTAEATAELKQTIRCASASGKIEVKSSVTEKNGALTGTWTELIYNMSGELTGQVTPRGLRVAVKGPDLDANMDVIVKDTKQVIEIQFHNTTLVGLTLILTKSAEPPGS
jgi:hypothetical protein